MKLVYCDTCADVVPLKLKTWRVCECGLVGGQYNADGVTATIGGIQLPVPPAASGCVFPRVFGIANMFFWKNNWHDLSPERRQQARKEWGFKGEGDCWWGSYAGDNQLFFIHDAKGPRVDVTCELLDPIKDLYLVKLIKGPRIVYIDNRNDITQVVIPSVSLGRFSNTEPEEDSYQETR